ncbi:MAG TPA: glycosyltransferase family 87 protein [Bryobacteraceae bacterium]|nr:glycosyltransferase family 87 protein [Bryobacteraceae bacterium]
MAPPSPRIRRISLICLLAALGVLYAIGWFSPAIGLEYREGANLLQAVTGHVETNPPLFPWLLGLFALVSRQPQWLKLLPLLCAAGWLALTWRLLAKMGASRACCWMMIAIAAASPAVEHLATGLYPEMLFGLLAIGSLIALLDERPILSGVAAGLATVTMTSGAVLIVACLLTLVTYRRLRAAVMFLVPAMLFASPWLGWWMAHSGMPNTNLDLSEWSVLLWKNAIWLAAAPFTAMSGYANNYPGLLTAVALLIVLIRRRQFVPDLFFGLYCVALVCRPEPPLYAFAPVLPLFLWMLWRVVRRGRFALISQVTAIGLIASALWFGLGQALRPAGWPDYQKLFAVIRANTPQNAVLMTDLDPLYYLNTGRTSIRGFTPDGYRTWYAPPRPLVTPDELYATIPARRVDFVVMAPDREVPESVSYNNSIDALERGDFVEPVELPGLPAGYRLLRVVKRPRLPRSGAGTSH